MQFQRALPPADCVSNLARLMRSYPQGSRATRRNFTTSSQQRNIQHEDIRPMFDLKGRNFVVTGGGQGIGFAVTRSICEMGGNVAVMDLKDAPVQIFQSLSQEFGVKTRYIQADVTKHESLRKAFDETISDLGGVDGWSVTLFSAGMDAADWRSVTCAGVVVDKPFLEHTWDELRRVLDVNVTGTFFASQMAVQQMEQQGRGGSIVMIASSAAHVAIPGHRLAAYHASKGAVRILSKALSVELAPHGIRTNTISPGYIDSDMTQKLRKQYPHLVELMQTASPMERIGTVNDLTPAIIYLLSDASKYTTGTDIQVTGGLHAGRIKP